MFSGEEHRHRLRPVLCHDSSRRVWFTQALFVAIVIDLMMTGWIIAKEFSPLYWSELFWMDGFANSLFLCTSSFFTYRAGAATSFPCIRMGMFHFHFMQLLEDYKSARASLIISWHKLSVNAHNKTSKIKDIIVALPCLQQTQFLHHFV